MNYILIKDLPGKLNCSRTRIVSYLKKNSNIKKFLVDNPQKMAINKKILAISLDDFETVKDEINTFCERRVDRKWGF